MKTVRGGKVAIKKNDMIGPYFTTHKGVRQGDLFSPLLFNIAADGLACLIKNLKMKVSFKVLFLILSRVVAVVFNMLMTLFFLPQDNLEYVRNLKFILCLFEQMSVSRLTFTKVKSFVLVKHMMLKIVGDLFSNAMS
jgi:hypothetical protein